MYGKVERISPEAPVPIFKLCKEKQMLGGAGNVVANMASLGCQVTFIGIVGNEGSLHLCQKAQKPYRAHLMLLTDF